MGKRRSGRARIPIQNRKNRTRNGDSDSQAASSSIGETYDELQKAIVVISRSLTRLAFLLMDADITLKVFERVINEDVAKFWDLSPATRRN